MNSKSPLRSPRTTPVLPPELWNHIFLFLTTKDLISVINTNPEWNELLEERKKTFLLPLILPSLIEYLDINTFLNFRKISKSSKLEIDETMQKICNSDDDNPFGCHYEESSSQKYLRSVTFHFHFKFYFNFTFRLFFAKVLPNFPNISSDINPFLLGFIRYVWQFSLDPSLVTRNQHVVSILPKFGHHVRSIDVLLMEHGSNILPFTDFVSQLQLVPNLKRLEIQFGMKYNPMVFSSLPLPHLPTTTYDFPPMPKLALLDFNSLHGDRELISPFVSSMLRKYSQQLTVFTCTATLFTLPSLNLDLLNTSFPNLRKFHLLGERSEIPAALNKLSNVTWRLEKLRLEEDGCLAGELNPRDVLATIYNFRQSLVHLELKWELESRDTKEDNESEVEEEHRLMSQLKIIITDPRNLKMKLFLRFLRESCVCLKQLHFLTNGLDAVCFMEEGMWALENIKSLEKVVIWAEKGFWREEVTKHTMRRAEKSTS